MFLRYYKFFVPLSRLEVLYLGGNCLTEIPAELGALVSLISLTLCDNQLQSIPPTLSHLQRLQSLSLHNNQLSTLPPDIISLNLIELSLRNNPLVVQFVQEFVYEPPTLLELAGRIIKLENIPYSTGDAPSQLVAYLDAAHSCVNPKCRGMCVILNFAFEYFEPEKNSFKLWELSLSGSEDLSRDFQEPESDKSNVIPLSFVCLRALFHLVKTRSSLLLS